jgi:hypothetical protein
MAHLSVTAQQTTRWIGRVMGTLAAAFWLLILLDIVVCDAVGGFICINWEMALLVFIVAASMLCVTIAWRKEGLGGLILLLWGIIFTVFAGITSGSYRIPSMLVSGVPFLIAGLLLLGSWSLHRNYMRDGNAKGAL